MKNNMLIKTFCIQIPIFMPDIDFLPDLVVINIYSDYSCRTYLNGLLLKQEEQLDKDL